MMVRGQLHPLKVVLDTNVVVSTTLFRSGYLRPIRDAWQAGHLSAYVCEESNAELLRVLAYTKFKLSQDNIAHVLALYLPYAQSHKIKLHSKQEQMLPICRDTRDQIFLQLAHSAQVDYLVSGDDDLLSLSGESAMQHMSFKIITPAELMRLVDEYKTN